MNTSDNRGKLIGPKVTWIVIICDISLFFRIEKNCKNPRKHELSDFKTGIDTRERERRLCTRWDGGGERRGLKRPGGKGEVGGDGGGGRDQPH